MAFSQGQRSSSVSGWPALILATLLAGGNLSPSSQRQPIRPASASATVLFPEPDTPISTTAQGVDSATKILRKRGAVGEPDGLPGRAGAIGGQVLVCQEARQDRAFARSCNLEKHFAAGRERGQGERHPWHEWLDIGFGYTD